MGHQIEYKYRGKSYTVQQLSEMSGIPRTTIYQRIKRGYSIKDAITIPTRSIRRGHPDKVADDAYKFIVEYKTKNDGVSPTYRMVGDKFGMSTSQTRVLIDILVRKGLVALGEEGASRSIRVVGGKWIAPCDTAT